MDLRPLRIREFPDRGVKWLLAHPAHLRDLLRMVLGTESERVDWEGLRPFPTESLSESLRRQLADLVFTAPFRDPPGKEVVIFILVEHQSTPARAMRFRVLSYMIQLWDAQRQQWEREQTPEGQWWFRPIIPLVFYTGSSRWERVLGLEELMPLPPALARFVPHFDLLFLNLKALAADQLTASDTAFGHLLRVMQREEAPLEEFQRLLEDAVDQIEKLTATDRDEWARLLYYLLLLIYHRRAPEEEAMLRAAIEAHHQDRSRRQEIETMGKTIAQHLIEEGEARGKTIAQSLIEESEARGEAKGKAKGEAKGEVRGRQMVLLNQLQAKFGDLPPEVERRVRNLSMTELDHLAIQLIRAASLVELGL